MTGYASARKSRWRDALMVWKQPATWKPLLSGWLRPSLKSGALARLRGHDTSAFYEDGSEWLDLLRSELRCELESTAERLADALGRARMRTFHGCRTEDAGDYFRHGLRVHSREELVGRLRALVAGGRRSACLLPRLDELIAQHPSGTDDGRCYVVADDRALLRNAAHYLIYGSEWMCAVLGYDRDLLRDRGAPTVIEIDLPLSLVSPKIREELAGALLHEWTRQVTKPSRPVAERDFSFRLRIDLSPETVVGHYHPAALRDPLEGDRTYRPAQTRCRRCSPDN